MAQIIFLINGHEVCNPWELTDVSKLTRDDVVPYYRYMVLRKDFPDKEVWRVNRLILSKWSVSGLLYIKNKAWKNIPFSLTND